MSIRFLSTSALLAVAWLGFITGLAPAQTPDLTRCPAETSAQGKLRLVKYQVTELVVPVGGSDTAKSATREADLIRTIQDTIAPKSWASHGGRGTIDYFPLTMTLVVNQTVDVQEMIADLLAKLRREQDTQVILEVKLLTVPAACFERIGVDFNVKLNGPTGEESPCKAAVRPAPCAVEGLSDMGAFVTDKHVAQFLKTIQGDPGANILQTPTLTVLNGQMAYVDCTEKQPFVTGCEVVQRDGQPLIVPKTEDVVTGFRMSACPKVSADRRFVQVNLEMSQTDLASTVVPLCPVTVQIKGDQGKPAPFTQFLQQPKVNTLRIEKMAIIPDGGTVLLGGLKKEAEVRHECGTPILSGVPYVNRLFKNVGYGRETQMVYVLVTPRIVVHEEEECRQTGVRCEDVPACAEESEPRTDAPASRQAKVLAELLQAYDEACAAGEKKEAARFARAALTIDPTCFARRSGR